MSSIPIVSNVITTARFCYDLAFSMAVLFIGRLLPRIDVEHTDLTGKRAIVTGGNSGIGFSIATSLARRNATVYLACRNVKKAEEAAAKIIDSLSDGTGSSKRVHILQLDTSDLSSVRSLAETWQKKHNNAKIDILVHNAGIAGSSSEQSVTKEGLGMIYTTNHLGAYLLTSLLEDNLSNDARVVFTSSTGQYSCRPIQLFTNPGFVPRTGTFFNRPDSGYYGDTKCMQVIFAKLLQRRWIKAGTRRVANAFTPGYTFTPIFEKNKMLKGGFDPLFWFLNNATRISTSVEVGATTGLWLAASSDKLASDPKNGGRYWDRCVSRLGPADLIEVRYGIGMLERIWDLWLVDSKAEWSRCVDPS